MIKKILLALAIAILCRTVAAQPKHLVRGGVQFGFDLPTCQKDFGSHFNIEQSLNFEIGAFCRVGRHLYGQVGLYYFVNKMQVFNADTAINFTSAVELGQLNVPMWIGYAFFWNKVSLRLAVGAQYRGIVRLSNNKIEFNKDNVRLHNGDAMAGIGIDISNLSLDISYRKAFKSLGKTTDSRYFHDVVNLSIGVVF